MHVPAKADDIEEVPGAPAAPALLGVGGLGPLLPDVPIVPGLTGLRLDDVHGLTPPPDAVPPPPAGATPAAPAPLSPYYFISETSAFRGGTGTGLDSLVTAALRLEQFEPPLLDPATGAAGNSRTVPGADAVELGVLTEPDPPAFYFADRAVAATAGSNEAGLDPDGRLDVATIRRDFPILAERVNGKPLVWLDNAATTQKPQAVLDRLTHFYEHENSNIHRAAHELAARATDAYEGARKTVARFLGAPSEKNIVFVRGATEAINLVAKSWGPAHINRGDEIIVSHLEHHANIVPWQQLIAETGATLRVIPVDDSGQLILSEYGRLLSAKTKLVSVTQVSNALGTVTPVDQIVEMGHRAGACVLIDGAQSVPHLQVDVQALGADFFVFSGHKIFGPTGIGVLYGRREVLEVDATVGGRRQHDRRCDVREDRLPEPAESVRGRHRQHRRCRRPGAALDYVDPDRVAGHRPVRTCPARLRHVA